MDFVSDNGGSKYNLCHCTFFLSLSPSLPSSLFSLPSLIHTSSSYLSPLQSGPTSKSPTWTSGARKPTQSSSTTSTPRADSTTSAGATRPCIPSPPLCSSGRTRFTFSARLGTSIIRLIIVRRRRICGGGGGVAVIRRRRLVSLLSRFFFFAFLFSGGGFATFIYSFNPPLSYRTNHAFNDH